MNNALPAMLISTLVLAPAAIGQSETARPAVPSATPADTLEGYDFGQVVATMESSVHPLQREMDLSFRVFVETIEEAELLLDEGNTRDAVQKAAAALDGVLDVREGVLEPMWEGQQELSRQIAAVRARLAAAVQASRRGDEPALDDATEGTLDGLATRIQSERDPIRRQRLTAHYKTVRNIARIKRLAVQLSPDQRKLWMSVLTVLDEAAVAHQQVMMGSEVLFAQFEATSGNLKSYLSLMETVDGASDLMKMVRGADGLGAGMSGFADSMVELQERLSGFNQSVEQALQGRMIELESQIDLLEPMTGDFGGTDFGGAAADDAELAERISRISTGGNS